MRPNRVFSPDPDIAPVAALAADPVRASMLYALLGGAELPASELASRGGASPQAASAHLAKLVEGRLLAVRALGRQRLFRLASADVAHLMEALAALAQPVRVRALGQDVQMRRLREARSCYDHLAGRIGVALTDRLVERSFVRRSEGQFSVTESGTAFLSSLGVDVESARAQRRSFARACVDWTERRPHLAGALGAALLDRFVGARWLERNARDRSLHLTPQGRKQFLRLFGIEPAR